MRLARTRYNHFAGRLGVGFADAMLARGQIELDQDGDTVTEAGHDFLNSFGVTFGPPRLLAGCSAAHAWIGVSGGRISPV